MRHLLNTLFVTSEDAYLSLEGENVLVNREKTVAGRFPLHNLQMIICFSYSGASPALMGACAEQGIVLAFCTPPWKVPCPHRWRSTRKCFASQNPVSMCG